MKNSCSQVFGIRTLKWAVFLAPTLAFAMGPAPAPAPKFDPSAPPPIELRFADDISQERRELMLGDLWFLKNLEIKDPDSEMLKFLKLRTGSSSEMLEWLGRHVNIMVGEDYDDFSSLIDVGERFQFPYPDVDPYEDDEVPLPPAKPVSASGFRGGRTARGVASAGASTLRMFNIGSHYYRVSKIDGKLKGFPIPGVGLVKLTSPLVGLLQVGPAYFWSLRDSIPMSSPGNSIYRLATLFHEGRHGDGHGKTLGFSHIECPSGHPSQGMYSCDRSLNGPYAVGAAVIRTLVRACRACSEVERKDLTEIASVYQERVVRVSVPTQAQWDAWNELSEKCIDLEAGVRKGRRLNSEGKILQKKCARLEEERPREVPSFEWEDEPEGQR